MAYGPAEFSREPDVTSQLVNDMQHWVALLETWNTRINLVSAAAMHRLWQRHILDSWQLWAHVDHSAPKILDLGSGAGFPGLAMAMGCKYQGGGHVTLTESIGKKANFLRTVIRDLELPATVQASRIESLAPLRYDIITARAFAPLPRLLTYAKPFCGEGTRLLLLKGQGVSEELIEARQDWSFDNKQIISRSGDGTVLILSNILNN